ncbi:MAG: VWA domain-containing protein [Acidobacteria bacterium]|nr:VWA domain-containing protein [Acidobacteriota bacterium]
MKRRDFLASVVPAAALTAPALAVGQDKPGARAKTQSDALAASVSEVIVPVTVTDDKGRFVGDLEQSDFEVYDENKLQNIRYFSRERNQPVVVGFLVDQSNANRLQWKKFQEAVEELVFTLLPGQPKYAGYLIGYSSEAELLANTTTDAEKVLEKVRKMKPGGGAAMYDAVYIACTSRTLVKGEPVEPRRIIVIVGDGHDNASKKSLDEVLELAQRNLVTIYGVSTTAFGFGSDGEKNLVKLAEETGGRVEYPLQNVYKDVSGYLSTPSDEGNYALKVGTGGYASAIAQGLFKAVANVTGEITTQYIMRYTPDNTDVKPKVFRKIRVEVPRFPTAKVRARTGYYPYNP